MEKGKINNMKTLKLEVLDLTNYTTKQIKSLKKGWEIYVSGTIGGCWEDIEFNNKNSDNKHWKYFYDTFKETDLYINNEYGKISSDEMFSRYDKIQTILMNTFDFSYSEDFIKDRDYSNIFDYKYETIYDEKGEVWN